MRRMMPVERSRCIYCGRTDNITDDHVTPRNLFPKPRTIPTWLMFLFLGFASFAPVVVGLRPGRWMPYYFGALMVWWVLVCVASLRREERELFRKVRQLQDAMQVAAAPADAVRHAFAGDRLIIVARQKVDSISRDHLGDDAVRVITDRRGTDRRLKLEVYIPDRRSGERRRYDIDSLLATQGWAEVTLRKS